MHIVFIRFTSMGDVVMQTSLVNFLKENFPKCTVTFVTHKMNSVFLNNHPHIENTLYYEKANGSADFSNLLQLAKKIKALKPDMLIDLHDTLRSKIIRKLLYSLPSVTANKRGIARTLLVKTKIDLLAKLPPQHERLRHDFATLFNLNPEQKDIALTSINSDYSAKDELLIIIAPIASFAAKRWSITHFKQLIELYLKDSKFVGHQVAIVGGPDDDYCQELTHEISDPRVINYQGRLSLSETVLLISKCHFLVGNDTGMNHIAESFNKPVITLFGATSPSFGFRPHLKQSKYVYKNWKCSPCSKTGSKSCSRPTHECMNAITPDEILQHSKEFLGALA